MVKGQVGPRTCKLVPFLMNDSEYMYPCGRTRTCEHAPVLMCVVRCSCEPRAHAISTGMFTHAHVARMQARDDSMQWIPPAWRAQGKTLLWWRSQLIAFVWKPLPHVLEHIESRRQAMQWPGIGAAARGGTVLAVHVRRGDKGGGGRAGRIVVDMDTYVDQLRSLVAAVAADGVGHDHMATDERSENEVVRDKGAVQRGPARVSHVFIGGDDQETVDLFRREVRALGLVAMVDDEEARTSTDNSVEM